MIIIMAFMSKSKKLIKLTYFLALMFQHFFNTPNPSKEENNKSILLKENHSLTKGCWTYLSTNYFFGST